jgi:uncharacterized protein (DUF2235 family)
MKLQEKPFSGCPRRLIVCCDGTWNAADAGPSATNVVRMLRCIAPQAEDGTSQIARYNPGVGTGNPLDRMLGGAMGLGLAPAIRDVYAFLVNNYVPGDEIFLFGFSRGAFTARSIAGLIGSIGFSRTLRAEGPVALPKVVVEPLATTYLRCHRSYFPP